MGSTITASSTPPFEVSLQTIHLRQAWPSRIGVEHFAGGKDASLNAPVTFADFLNGEEIGLNLPKPTLWIFRRKELLNVVVQHGLVFFHRKNVVATLLHNLS